MCGLCKAAWGPQFCTSWAKIVIFRGFSKNFSELLDSNYTQNFQPEMAGFGSKMSYKTKSFITLSKLMTF